MSDHVWRPDPARIEAANITRFAREEGVEIDSSRVEQTESALRAFVR